MHYEIKLMQFYNFLRRIHFFYTEYVRNNNLIFFASWNEFCSSQNFAISYKNLCIHANDAEKSGDDCKNAAQWSVAKKIDSFVQTDIIWK